MATLKGLLDLLPDNTLGRIDAADLCSIVTTLWDADQTELAARVAAIALISQPYDHIEMVAEPTEVPVGEGVLSWNTNDSTLEMQTRFPGVVIQVSQELVAKVRNHTGATILNGSAVYVTGAQGDRPTVALAQAGVETSEDRLLGLATADIANNAEGVVTMVGVVNELDTSGFNAGDLLYLGPTPGSLSTTKSRGFIGMVLRSHPTLGKVGIRVTPPPQVDELTAGLIATPTSLVRAALDQYLIDKGLL